MLRRLALAAAAALIAITAVPMTQASALPSDCAYGTPLDCDCSAATPCMGVSAPNAQLRGKNLRGANLTGANLRGADLRRANLSGAILTRVNLAGARLNGANLSGARLIRANLAGAKLDGANFSGAKILSARITGVSAVRTNWSRAKFGPAPAGRKGPPGSAPMASSYNGGSMSGNQCGANFMNADIENVVFSGDYSAATCGKAATFALAQIYMSDFTGVNFQSVNANAIIILTDFTNAQMQGTDFYQAGGSGLILSGVQFGTDQTTSKVTVYPQVTVFPNSVCPNNRQGTFESTGCVNT